MGGDGGTKAVKRSYLRGAGAATTSADLARRGAGSKLDPSVAAQEAQRRFTHCAVSEQPLDFKDGDIVACPYGRLYNREAAVEALIAQKQKQHQDDDAPSSSSMAHIRGLKDLYSCKFQTAANNIPICPITARELTRCTAYVLLSNKKSTTTTTTDDEQQQQQQAISNVVSEYALKEMGEEALLQEYGASRKLRLAPTLDLLKEIERQWQEQCATEKVLQAATKKKSKKKHKRSHHDEKEPSSSKKKKKKEDEL